MGIWQGGRYEACRDHCNETVERIENALKKAV